MTVPEAGGHYLERPYGDEEDSSAVETATYYEVDDYRFDALGLDGDGEIVIALEAERSNHATKTAVPADSDKIAAHDPEEAIWIVRNRETAHEVLQALNDPPDGKSRFEKTYSENMALRQFKVETPGLTDVSPITFFRDSFLTPEFGG